MATRVAERPSSGGWAPDVGTSLIAACAVLLAATVVVGRGVEPVAAMLIVLSALVAWHRWILSWHVLLCFLLAVVLFIPVGRYSLPIELPFGLEPYRVAVALVVVVWVASLLVDPRVRLRRTPLDAPVALIVAATLGSVVVNYGRVVPLQSVVLKAVTVFLSFVILYYFISSVVTTAGAVLAAAKFFVAAVSVVAFFSIIEQRTGFNLFDHVQTVLPFLEYQGGAQSFRYGLLRATGSADHPIALGVLFGTTFPVALALAMSRSRVWWGPTAIVLIAVLATTSRTPVLVMATVAVVFLWLRPREVARVLPLMIPMLLVIKIVAPGSIASVKEAFFPSEGPGLIAEQSELTADPTLISGRANFKPRLVEGMRRPLLGQGLGTRQTGFNNPLRNAPVLDNQWLGTFLDIGLLGVVGWVWLIARSVRRLGRIGRTRGDPDGWLAVGFVGAIAGFGVAMATYDALAFIQEAVILWVVLALAAALIRAHAKDSGALRPRALP